MTTAPIYLDYNATTPVDEGVLASMWPYFSQEYGNAASPHTYGRAAFDAVELARAQLASLVGARPRDVVFTSGATEANNLALLGLAETACGDRRQIVSCATEHHAVLEPLERLAKRGFTIDLCSVDNTGRPDVDELRSLCSSHTLLVSVMAANNETGTLAPLADIGAIAAEVGAFFHTDASQMVGKLPINMELIGAHLLSLSAHKFYGPKGAGALVVDRRVPLSAITSGGGQERGLRSGTLNVAGSVGAGAAAALALHTMDEEAVRVAALRAQLEKRLMADVSKTILNGGSDRLPNTVNLTFLDAEADAVMANMPRIAVSSGSACSSATPAPSHVLLAMGRPPSEALCAVRFSLGRRTTQEDVTIAVDEVRRAVDVVRSRTQEPVA